MKYFFRKFRMMHVCLKQVKDDKCRTEETRKAVLYVLTHPSLLFTKKHIVTNHDSVLKTVNAITNYPYFEKLYQGAVK